MLVRRRLPAALIGLSAFVLLGALDEHRFWSEPWFFIGIGIVLAAAFVEPYFGRPQDAIVNAVGGMAVYATVERDPIQGLWTAYLASVAVILVAGLVATIAGDSPSGLKWASYRLSSRLGRAVVVGAAALVLLVIGEAASGEDGFQYLALGTAVLVLAVGVDWTAFLARVANRPAAAAMIGAVGPRLLLIVTSRETFPPGERVAVAGAAGSSDGTVIARLPHKAGVHHQVALDDEWSAVAMGFPSDVSIRAADRSDESLVAGTVGDGSTERRLHFEPVYAASIGDPVVLRLDDNRQLLYQVASLRLTSFNSAGGHAVARHAVARMVGWPEDGWIRGGSRLPQPHEPIYRSSLLRSELPEGHYEVGHIKGTEIPVGLRIDQLRRGHIAILGMTGMGKTGVAHRICRTLGASNVVVALDTTGEYARRLGFPAYGNSLTALGHSVYEPAGDPPKKAAEFIKQCMEAGHGEFTAGGPIIPRVVLLEEAHTFVPEWNFGLRHHQDYVSESTRMIMQARKFGITFIIVSQRTAVVSKSALSQCENYIILRTIDQTSLDYVETLVGPELRQAISELGRFEAITVGPAFNSEEPVIVSLSAP